MKDCTSKITYLKWFTYETTWRNKTLVSLNVSRQKCDGLRVAFLSGCPTSFESKQCCKCAAETSHLILNLHRLIMNHLNKVYKKKTITTIFQVSNNFKM